jgi:hypothetical protein
VNPPFHKIVKTDRSVDSDSFLSEIYPELRSRHCEFIVNNNNNNSINLFHSGHDHNSNNQSFIFAIDCCNINGTADSDNSVFELIRLGLGKLPKSTRVCFLLYNINNNNTVSIIRLVNILSAAETIVEMDTLSNR